MLHKTITTPEPNYRNSVHVATEIFLSSDDIVIFTSHLFILLEIMISNVALNNVQ